MMTNNNLSNEFDAQCAFAETLAAVLYGEATTSERAEFDYHAAGCQSCRQELIEFGALRNSIGEYRETVLQNVAAPEIVLPQIRVQTHGEKLSWLTNLREFLFAPNKTWQTATAFAAFLICAALVFVFASGILQSAADRQVVQNDLKTQPTPQKSNESKSVAEPLQTAESPKSKSPEKSAAANVPAANPAEAQLPQKPAARNNNVQPHVKAVSPEAKPRQTKSKPAPRRIELEFDDDAPEDDSLRLSDLLDEVGSVK